LFKDFWERFLDSLRALKDKQIRTVYRMTLVKDHNMKEVTPCCGSLRHVPKCDEHQE